MGSDKAEDDLRVANDVFLSLQSIARHLEWPSSGRYGGKATITAMQDVQLTMSQISPSSMSSTAAAVTFITLIQDLKRQSEEWEPMIEICADGEKTLERFRFQFPEDWLYSDQLRGEWSAFNEILQRKSSSIQDQLGALYFFFGS